MIKSNLLFVALAAAGLSACVEAENRIPFDGQYFRANTAKVDKQRDVFVVTVKDPTKSIDGARAAALHEATSYCLNHYGTSEIIWQVDPADDTAQVNVVDNRISYQGRCPQAQNN